MTEHPLANYPRPPPRGEDLPHEDGEPLESGRHRAQLNVSIQAEAFERIVAEQVGADAPR